MSTNYDVARSTQVNQSEPLFGTTALIIGFILGVIPGFIMLIANAFSGGSNATMEDVFDRVQESPPPSTSKTTRKVGEVANRPESSSVKKSADPQPPKVSVSSQKHEAKPTRQDPVKLAKRIAGQMDEKIKELKSNDRCSEKYLDELTQWILQVLEKTKDNKTSASENILLPKSEELKEAIAIRKGLIIVKQEAEKLEGAKRALATANNSGIDFSLVKEAVDEDYKLIQKFLEEDLSGFTGATQVQVRYRNASREYLAEVKKIETEQKVPSRKPLSPLNGSELNRQAPLKKKATPTKKSKKPGVPTKKTTSPSIATAKPMTALDLWLEYQDAYSKEAIQTRKPDFIRDLKRLPESAHNDTYVKTLKERFNVK